MMKQKHVAFAVLSLFALVGSPALAQTLSYPNPDMPVACTMDARQCSDGTWVGRSGPNCEFVCPGDTSGSGSSGSGGSLPVVVAVQPGLRFGMRGAAIVVLQKKLAADGYLAANMATGYFGPLTLASVKRFQADHNLPVTGFVGPMTVDVMNGR